MTIAVKLRMFFPARTGRFGPGSVSMEERESACALKIESLVFPHTHTQTHANTQYTQCFKHSQTFICTEVLGYSVTQQRLRVRLLAERKHHLPKVVISAIVAPLPKERNKKKEQNKRRNKNRKCAFRDSQSWHTWP